MSTDEFIDRDELLTQDERDALMEVVSKKSLTSSAVTSEFREGVASYDLSGCDYAINSLLPVNSTRLIAIPSRHLGAIQRVVGALG